VGLGDGRGDAVVVGIGLMDGCWYLDSVLVKGKHGV
jgi:hypothetical protein